MKLLVAMLPTLVLVVFSQLVSKWRVQLLKGQLTGDSAGRLVSYLSDFWIWASYGAAFLAGIFWLLVVERYAISLAFPVYIGLTVLFVTLGGVLLFGEAIRPLQAVAVLLIVTGVALAVNS
jgi:multidrug transporter EmrE-like cation transporter